jgi:acyl-CoA reductase-like NAD-dependent aldehyde dehydrogenase
MSLASETSAPIRHADRFFIGGQWVAPSSDSTIKVIDSGTEETYFTVAEAQAADISWAVEAARGAFDNGPWTGLTHAERAVYLRAIGAELASGARTSARSGRVSPASCTPSAVGLPAGVLNVVTADREVSELLVRDPRVDKITFTGSTAAGRRSSDRSCR